MAGCKQIMIKIVLFLISSAVFATQISIQADNAIINNIKQLTIYTGNVRLVRNDMIIMADNIIIQTLDSTKKHYKIIANDSENLAKFNKSGESYIKAEAQQIIYNTTDNLLNLIGNATIVRQGSELSGENIIYDTTNDKINMQSDDDKKVRIQLDL
jgi:lipopolysaccharide export system protein LptA